MSLNYDDFPILLKKTVAMVTLASKVLEKPTNLFMILIHVIFLIWDKNNYSEWLVHRLLIKPQRGAGNGTW